MNGHTNINLLVLYYNQNKKIPLNKTQERRFYDRGKTESKEEVQQEVLLKMLQEIQI